MDVAKVLEPKFALLLLAKTRDLAYRAAHAYKFALLENGT